MKHTRLARFLSPKAFMILAASAAFVALLGFLTLLPARGGLEFTGPSEWTTLPSVVPPNDLGSKTSPGAGLGKLTVDPPGTLTDDPSGFALTNITIDYESVEADIGKNVHIVYMIERPMRFTSGTYTNAVTISGSLHLDALLKSSPQSAIMVRWGSGVRELFGTTALISTPTLPANRPANPTYYFRDEVGVIKTKTNTGGKTNLQQVFSILLSPTASGQHFTIRYDSVR